MYCINQVSGVSTIRAYGSEERFLRVSEQRVDANHRAFFWLWAANRWLSVRIDWVAAIVVFSAGMSVVFTNIPAGLAGLSMTYALQFTESLLVWIFSPVFIKVDCSTTCSNGNEYELR